MVRYTIMVLLYSLEMEAAMKIQTNENYISIEEVAEYLGQHRINAKNRIMQWVPNKNCG